jgi:hypothetical protein
MAKGGEGSEAVSGEPVIPESTLAGMTCVDAYCISVCMHCMHAWEIDRLCGDSSMHMNAFSAGHLPCTHH